MTIYYLIFVWGSLILNTFDCSDIIDVNYILEEDLMPSTLLMLENPEKSIRAFIKNDSINLNNERELEGSRGSFDEAIKTISYHRNMMNQYLCRTYLAEQVVTEMSMTRINRRMGHASPGVDQTDGKHSKFQLSANTLLSDEGSSGYKDWLSKSTTLEDIYRHYNQFSEDRTDKVGKNEEEKMDEDFDENAALSDYSTNKGGGGGYSYGSPYSGGHSGGGYSGDVGHSGGGYAVHEPPVEHVYEDVVYHGPPKYHVHYETKDNDKDKNLADFFEIALTALAFLAFKMFIAHVIMCISSMTSSSTTTPTVITGMSMSPTVTGTGMTNSGGGNTGPGMGTGGGNTGTGGGNTGTGDNNPGTGTGDGSTGTGGSSTGTGDTTPGTGTGGGNTGTGGGSTDTGDDNTGDGGSTGMGNTDGTATGGGDGSSGNTATGGGMTGTGNGGSTGTDTTDTDMENTNTGNGDSTSMGVTSTTGTGETTGPATGTDNANNGGDGTTGGGTGGGIGDTDTTSGTSPGTGSDESTGGGSTSGETTGRSDTLKFRLKRNIPSITNPDTETLNELARKVLISIETALIANEDHGVCLHKSLCENNKWSRSLDDRNKLLVPIWSLGMSWLSGKLVKNVPSTTTMLDALKASILGLGNANCETVYPSCDLRKGIVKRRKKRRKRNVK